MTMPTEDPETTRTQWLDPFPEPHTIPSGWDLSELIDDTQLSASSKDVRASEAEAN